METDENRDPNKPSITPANTADDLQKKKKMKLSYEDYRNISNLLVMHMRKEEESMEESSEATETTGLKRSAIINWYLSELGEDIESEAELIEKKALVEKVLDRLTYHDQVIIPLTRSGLKEKMSSQASEEEDDPFLVVHPNYVIDA